MSNNSRPKSSFLSLSSHRFNLERDIDTLKHKVRELEDHNNTLKTNVYERQNVLEEVLQSNKKLKQELDNNKYDKVKEIEKSKESIYKYKKYTADLCKDLSLKQDQVNSLSTENEKLKETILMTNLSQEKEKIEETLQMYEKQQRVMNETMDEYRTIIDDLTKKLSKSDDEVKCLQEQNMKFKESFESNVKEHSEMIDTLNNFKKKIKDQEQEISMSQDLINNFRIRNESDDYKLQLKNEELSEANNRMTEYIQNLEMTVQQRESKDAVNNLQLECDNLKKILNVKNSTLTNKIKEKQELQENIIQNDNTIYKLKDDLFKKQDQEKKFNSKKVKLESEVKSLTIENKELKETIGNKVREKEELEKAIFQYKNNIDDLRKSLSLKQDQVKSLIAENEKLKETISSFRKRNISLKEELSKLQTETSDFFIQRNELNKFSSIPSSSHGSSHIINLRQEYVKMKQLLEDKDAELKDLKDEISNVKATLKCFEDKHSVLHATSDDRHNFSSIPIFHSDVLDPRRSVINLRQQNEELKNLLYLKGEEIKKKQNAINVMKEKLQSQKNDSDINILTRLRQQNVTYSIKLEEAVIEEEKFKESNKRLNDEAALLKLDNLRLRDDMENLKRLNFNNERVSVVSQSSYVESRIPPWWRLHMSNLG